MMRRDEWKKLFCRKSKTHIYLVDCMKSISRFLVKHDTFIFVILFQVISCIYVLHNYLCYVTPTFDFICLPMKPQTNSTLFR